MSNVVYSTQLMNAIRTGGIPTDQAYSTWFIGSNRGTPMSMAITNRRYDVVLGIIEKIFAFGSIEDNDEQTSVNIGEITVSYPCNSAKAAIHRVQDTIVVDDNLELYMMLLANPAISGPVIGDSPDTNIELFFIGQCSIKCLQHALRNHPGRLNPNDADWARFLYYQRWNSDMYIQDGTLNQRTIDHSYILEILPMMVDRAKRVDVLSANTLASLLSISIHTTELLLDDVELCRRVENYRSENLKIVFDILVEHNLLDYAKLVLRKIRASGIEPDLDISFGKLMGSAKSLTPYGFGIALEIFGVNRLLPVDSHPLLHTRNFLYYASTLETCSDLLPGLLAAGFSLPLDDVDIFISWYINHYRDFHIAAVATIKSFVSAETWTRISEQHWRFAIYKSRYDLLDMLDLSVIVIDRAILALLSDSRNSLLRFLLSRGFVDRIYENRAQLTIHAEEQVLDFMHDRDMARAACAATLDRRLVDDVIRMINDFV